ncbi:MAG TPA: hypothetical protein VIW27_08685 [Gammaproteobacteria bacterium]|jgi:hypothetical protein
MPFNFPLFVIVIVISTIAQESRQGRYQIPADDSSPKWGKFEIFWKVIEGLPAIAKPPASSGSSRFDDLSAWCSTTPPRATVSGAGRAGARTDATHRVGNRAID